MTSFTPAYRGGAGEPLVLVHGIVDTWRTWELVLPALERRFDVLAPTLADHAGGPQGDMLHALETAMDDADFATAHVAGNSLGGYLALRLAERGRALSVVAFAPAGGLRGNAEHFVAVQSAARAFAPHVHASTLTDKGRRRATQFITERYEHIPAELVAHQIRGVAACADVESLLPAEWPLDPARVTCPVRIVWGASDKILPWPGAASRYRDAFPNADWVVLDGVGHCPQLDVPAETAELIAGFS